MCGIAGILLPSPTGNTSTGLHRYHGDMEAVLNSMVRCLQHRGPDGCGIEEVHGSEALSVGLGHARLAILDLSSAGHQPMLDPTTGNWISYNGEIYNFRQLRSTLDDSSTPWRSETDTEVILRAYAKWGRHCLDDLRGMFALAIWDSQRQVLFLARDRLGIKPLYYFDRDGHFLFSSEVRSLLASELVPRELDPVAFNEYLAYQSVPAPRTMIQGVQALPPGTWMEVDASGHTRLHCYWDLAEEGNLQAGDVSLCEAQRHIGELLQESVALHLVSDVPVGVFLSGGIDSSAIVALMRKNSRVPRTFSVSFSESKFDETRHAKQVARQFRTEHTEIRLTEESLLDQLPDALAAMDQPTGDGVNTYVVSKAVRSAGVTVALSGLGGDEFFGGYPSFRRLSRSKGLLEAWGYLPTRLRFLTARAFRALASPSIAATKMTAILETKGTLAETYPLLRQVLSRSQRELLVADCCLPMTQSRDDPYASLLRQAFTSRALESPLAQVSYAEARTYMHDVLLRDTDQMSMAHSLEVRVPLLDHKLVEHVISLPDAYKRPNGFAKPLLVNSLGVKLPHDITHRPKQGFTLPFDLWMRRDLKRFCEDRLSPDRVGGRGLLKPKEVEKLWQAFLSRRQDVSWSRLWILVVLEEWLEQNRVQCGSWATVSNE